MGEENLRCGSLLSYAELIVCDTEIAVPRGKPVHSITREWIDRVFFSSERAPGEDGPAPAIIGLDDPIRITRSSGTTGGLKMMLITRQMKELRLQQTAVHKGSRPNIKFLLCNPFTVNAIYERATVCLRLGSTSILDDSNDPIGAIVKYKPDIVYFLPLPLLQTLDRLPAAFVKPERLTVAIGGSPLSAEQRQRVLAVLATEILYNYSTNEVGIICDIDAEGIGTLVPGVQAEIVDEDGNRLPSGAPGRIRIKSPAMVTGYLDNREATAQMFRDGWFYTGDVGIMEGPRRLKLVGRHDEIINIGGFKVSPDSIEEVLRRDPLIKDVAVTSIQNEKGIDEIAVAVVSDVLTDAAIAERMKGVPRYLGKIHARIVAQIPRNPVGKVQRHLLRSAFLPRGNHEI